MHGQTLLNYRRSPGRPWTFACLEALHVPRETNLAGQYTQRPIWDQLAVTNLYKSDALTICI